MTEFYQRALLDMEVDIFDVRDWGLAVHMAAHAIHDEEQRAALALLGNRIERLGEQLRAGWRAASGFDRGRQ
ncbi:hypothetical protein C0214_13685 [Methylobacterium sp. DM1]|nr:hypothetical protein C0214_13685 [Methylobacterium sp. DM1]